ncbi:MAG: hypothetical protein GY866_02375, partial [Proteobacteria bacterium]|nr:hypothetical protein [Pseudomonadota bacterium]
IVEGFYRKEFDIDDRKTDTPENEDKKEREDQAYQQLRDILIGVKWTHLPLLRRLVRGEERKTARQGIINAKLYYSTQGKKMVLSLAHPF